MSNWISTKDKRPDLIKGENYSANVLAVESGQLKVMCYCWIDFEIGYLWADCNGDINGDGYFDDDYNVTHWMPLPELPKENI